MAATTVRDDARRLADRLPDDATWDDVLYEVNVRQAVEAGLADIAAGRVHTPEEARRLLG